MRFRETTTPSSSPCEECIVPLLRWIILAYICIIIMMVLLAALVRLKMRNTFLEQWRIWREQQRLSLLESGRLAFVNKVRKIIAETPADHGAHYLVVSEQALTEELRSNVCTVCLSDTQLCLACRSCNRTIVGECCVEQYIVNMDDASSCPSCRQDASVLHVV